MAITEGLTYSPVLNARLVCRDMAAFLRENPSAWTQGSWGRTADGTPCDPQHSAAVSFCLGGLITRYTSHSNQLRDDVVRLIESRLPAHCHSIPGYNDTFARDARDIVTLIEAAASTTRDPISERFDLRTDLDIALTVKIINTFVAGNPVEKLMEKIAHEINEQEAVAA